MHGSTAAVPSIDVCQLTNTLGISGREVADKMELQRYALVLFVLFDSILARSSFLSINRRFLTNRPEPDFCLVLFESSSPA